MKYLWLTIAAAFGFGSLAAQSMYLQALEAHYNPDLRPFYHGVASGDPAPDAVIIWTKLTPEDKLPHEVGWQFAADSLFQYIVQEGSQQTSEASNWTVMMDVKGLLPAHYYYYRFSFSGRFSTVGRTKTAPNTDTPELTFGVVSCANFEAGFYNAYRVLADQHEVDAVLHLGDYIYEMAAGRHAKPTKGREHIPAREIVALDDYRARYAQYRLDPDLQRLHARFPIIAIWDDHEIANDSYRDGASNHQPKIEGNWEARKTAAKQAYFEWLPVRLSHGQQLYRKLSFGPMADLWMLDERLEGRQKQPTDMASPDYLDSTRTMLGETQFNWLTAGMNQSSARWQIIGNQVIMSSIDGSNVSRKNSKSMDMWDGYPVERDRLLSRFEAMKSRNIVVVTGDCHTAWAFDLTRWPRDRRAYNRRTGQGVLGIEFTTPSITSANFDEIFGKPAAVAGKRIFKLGGKNPHVRYLDITHHGFLLLTLTPTAATGTWIFVRDIRRPDHRWRTAHTHTYRLPVR